MPRCKARVKEMKWLFDVLVSFVITVQGLSHMESGKLLEKIPLLDWPEGKHVMDFLD